MKRSTKGRYAVMARTDLVVQGSGAPVTLADIAERQEISVSYLEQLFAKLRKGGLVRSVRGPGGGYLLSRPADEMRISDIVVAAEESLAQTRCRPGLSVGCGGNAGRCLTHDLWEELGNQIHLFLSSVSLEDVTARRVLGASGFLHQERCEPSSAVGSAPAAN